MVDHRISRNNLGGEAIKIPFENYKWENSRFSEQKPYSNCCSGFIFSYSSSRSKRFHRIQDIGISHCLKVCIIPLHFYNRPTLEK